MAVLRRVPEKIEFCFLLTEGYSQMSLTLMLEILREANRILGDERYMIALVADDARVRAVNPEVCSLAEIDGRAESAVLALVGGSSVITGCSERVAAFIRQQQRRGACLMAVEGGVGVLGALGMLRGRSVSCHVGHQRYLADLYPEVSLNTNLFSVSDGVYSCAGGVATVDMLFDLVERFTPSVYEELCVRLAVDQPRSGTVAQRNVVQRRYSGLGQGLVDAIELMEANIDEVLSITEIADHCGISKRQLERLFKKHLAQSPSQFYLQLRLKRARNRILNSTSPVLDVAYSCGFAAPTHFSRCYKAFFGISPKKDRQSLLAAC